MPKVSVTIPTYNRGYIVKQAIDSVLAQNFKDFEILIIDDGSTDSTKQVVESIQDVRLRYFYKENGGVSSARNLGLSKASGQYVAFLDSDDIWPEDFLKVMTERLDENPDFDLAYTATTLRFPDGREESDDVSRCLSGQITAHLFAYSTIWPMAVLIRRAVLRDFWFDEGLKICDDNDAFLRLSAKTKILFVSDIEVKRGYSEDNHSQKYYTEGSYIRALSLERFYYQLGGDKFVPATIAKKKLSRCYRRAGERYRKAGYRRAAICLLHQAIQYKPSDIRLYIGLFRTMFIKKDANPGWQMPAALGAPVGTNRFLPE
jgi:glycosyltransferase involved in cell wall biosynthesis